MKRYHWVKLIDVSNLIGSQVPFYNYIEKSKIWTTIYHIEYCNLLDENV